jgi:hypothetical protein
VARLKPDSLRVRHPQPFIFKIHVGDEVFPAALVRLKTIGKTGKIDYGHPNNSMKKFAPWYLTNPIYIARCGKVGAMRFLLNCSELSLVRPRDDSTKNARTICRSNEAKVNPELDARRSSTKRA